MHISVFDLFTVGIGHSVSHTVGPMQAASKFASRLTSLGLLSRTRSVRAVLYGPLAAATYGRGTQAATAVGLEGARPMDVDPDELEATIHRIHASRSLKLAGKQYISFSLDDIVLQPSEMLPGHTSGIKFAAFSADRESPIMEEIYNGMGGAFCSKNGITQHQAIRARSVPYPFSSCRELLELCQSHNSSISDLVLVNERASKSWAEIRDGLLEIYQLMNHVISRGIQREGTLPGAPKIQRMANAVFQQLSTDDCDFDPYFAPEWVNLVGLAVNEESAYWSGVVTAPTTGAAGIIPAVLYYATTYVPRIAKASLKEKNNAIVRFFLTAAALGVLNKEWTSPLEAREGCQREVKTAASMAAAGLTELLGGTPQQIVKAAEMASEESAAGSCNPVCGLVNVPCIQRNANVANMAINAARMSLRGQDAHRRDSIETVAHSFASTISLL